MLYTIIQNKYNIDKDILKGLITMHWESMKHLKTYEKREIEI